MESETYIALSFFYEIIPKYTQNECVNTFFDKTELK